MIFIAYFISVFGNFLVHKCIHITIITCINIRALLISINYQLRFKTLSTGRLMILTAFTQAVL